MYFAYFRKSFPPIALIVQISNKHFIIVYMTSYCKTYWQVLWCQRNRTLWDVLSQENNQRQGDNSNSVSTAGVAQFNICPASVAFATVRPKPRHSHYEQLLFNICRYGYSVHFGKCGIFIGMLTLVLIYHTGWRTTAPIPKKLGRWVRRE